jgi:hypothetical protein
MLLRLLQPFTYFLGFLLSLACLAECSSRSKGLKKKACVQQFISAPVFAAAAIFVALRESASPISVLSIVFPAAPAAAVSWSIIAMIMTEGIGQFLLAYSTWHGDGESLPDVEFKGTALLYNIMTALAHLYCTFVISIRVHMSGGSFQANRSGFANGARKRRESSFGAPYFPLFALTSSFLHSGTICFTAFVFAKIHSYPSERGCFAQTLLVSLGHWWRFQ